MRTVSLALAAVLCHFLPTAAEAAPLGRIHGVVRAADGSPASGVRVAVRHVDLGEAAAAAVTTDAGGEYAVLWLPEGDYDVVATAGDATIARRAWVTADVSRRVDMTMAIAAPSGSGGAPTGNTLIAYYPGVTPSRVAVGGELAFVVRPGAGSVNVVVVRPDLVVTSGPATYSASLDVLTKGPDDASDPPLQSGSIAVAIALGERGRADVRLKAGRQRFDLGNYSEAEVGGAWEKEIFERFVVAETRLGVETTSLFNRDSGDQWLAEAKAGGRLLVRMPCIQSMAWLGADFAVPLAHSGGEVRGRSGLPSELSPLEASEYLDPRLRVGLEVGFDFGKIEDWQLRLALRIRDRGDSEVPGTTLPILIGGGDQSEILFGVSRRLGGG